jgi:hypothetical protein
MIRCKELLIYSNKRLISRSLSTTGGDDQFSNRAEVAKGAMKDWIAQKREDAGTGFFAKISKEIAPPEAPASQQSNDNRPRQPFSESTQDNRAPAGQRVPPGLSGPPGRAMNKRLPSKRPSDNGPGGGYQGASSSANQDDGDTPSWTPGGRGRNKRGGGGKDDDIMQNRDSDFSFDSSKEEAVPPEILSQLLDHEYFVHLAANGGIPKINTEGMDPIEEFLAIAFHESFKTKSHTYETVLDGGFKKVVLPKARNMRDLMYAMQPKINSAKKGSEAYLIAEKAWGVINKNIYFSDKQKYQLTEGIARLSSRLLREVAENQDREYDLVLQPQFKKGPAYMEEQRRIALMMNEPYDELYEQEDTDWDIDAVVDEDQL